MRERPRNPGWPGRPDTGEIEIDGERWRWVTVGQVCPAGEKAPHRGSIAWCVRFCRVDRPEESFWHDLPDEPETVSRPPEEVLLSAFREGRPTVN